jgi:hypothetical protein
MLRAEGWMLTFFAFRTAATCVAFALCIDFPAIAFC